MDEGHSNDRSMALARAKLRELLPELAALYGVPLNQPAAIGLLLLIGVVVNNGIVMIEHINMYRRRGMPRHEAMIRGGRERLRPILMTAITTLVGLVPSTFPTSVLLPTTASLAEDGFALVGRGIVRAWRVVTFRGRKTREV